MIRASSQTAVMFMGLRSHLEITFCDFIHQTGTVMIYNYFQSSLSHYFAIPLNNTQYHPRHNNNLVSTCQFLHLLHGVFMFMWCVHVCHTLQPVCVRGLVVCVVEHSSMASGSWKMTLGNESLRSVKTFSFDFNMFWKC